ncbi:MAG: purine-nucleoside phosphorylase [Lachnospiraceae bacterium]|nr:purine-nucleoside phosphorylase [Lachnospiraceae bacterium]
MNRAAQIARSYEISIDEAVSYIRGRTELEPLIALVLGSGLGEYAAELTVEEEIPYTDIPDFPTSTAPGHDGRFILGYLDDVPVICMKGRVHLYEGYEPWDVVMPLRVMRELGAQVLFVTNASGGINYNFSAGDLMLITDHISSFAPNPLIGPNFDRFGTRFPDMTHVYDEELSDLIREAAVEEKVPLKEGVYVQLTGPSFESPAEIRMLRTLGADAVGMSTVIESIAAHHAGMRVVGVSCIANAAAGMTKELLSGDDVNLTANETAPLFTRLVNASIIRIGKAVS